MKLNFLMLHEKDVFRTNQLPQITKFCI